MRGFFYVLSFFAVMGLAFWAYQESYATRRALKTTSRLQHEIGTRREQLSVLRAEWAYLNRPARLRTLAEMNFDRLRLLPLRAAQFGRIDQVAFPGTAPGAITNSVTLSAPLEARR